MAQTPEGRVKDKVKKILKAWGCYQFWPVQNGMGAPALDCHGCVIGVAFFIETKAPGKEPTPRQLNTLRATEEAGGRNFVIDGDEGYIELTRWLEMIHAAMGDRA